MADKKIVFFYSASHVPDPIIEAARERVPNGFSFDLCENGCSDDERRKMVTAADYVLSYAVPFDDVDIADGIGVIQLLSAGFDRIDVDALATKGVPVANNGGANAPPVAETAIMLMLAVYKKLPLHHAALQDGEWLGHAHGLSMREIREKQVGIVGFGKIGQEVARMARGFLATIAYHDLNQAPPEIETGFEAKKMPLDELLETSDIITLHTFLDDSTRGMINADAFKRMKKSAILINTSRGPVVDEAALAEALDTGEIAGAGLDVFEEEPMKFPHSLLGRDNVVVTPHYAGATLDCWARRLDFGFANIARVANGEAPLATVA